MKYSKLLHLTSALLVVSSLAGQEGQQQSEVGVQQPVESSNGITGTAGYEVQYMYRDNPFYLDDAPTETAKSRMMVHTFFGAVSLPDSKRAPITTNNTIGVMKQLNRYQESQLEGFDYDTFSVFYKGDLDQIGSWKPSVGIAYATVDIVEADLNAFDGFFPYVSISKPYNDILATLKTSYSFTEVKGGTATDTDRLNAWTTGLSLAHNSEINNRMGFNSKASLDYALYNEGKNSGRDDLTFGAGTSLYYIINKHLKGDLFVEYTKRGSSMNYDYTNWDAGIKFNAALGF